MKELKYICKLNDEECIMEYQKKVQCPMCFYPYNNGCRYGEDREVDR